MRNFVFLGLLAERGMQRIFGKNYIMDENDSLSEYIKTHLVTIIPIALFTPKSTSKLRSALHFSYSIVI